jgi:hypothetical protein
MIFLYTPSILPVSSFNFQEIKNNIYSGTYWLLLIAIERLSTSDATWEQHESNIPWQSVHLQIRSFSLEFWVSSQQRIFTPPTRQTPPVVYPEVCFCLIPWFILVFPTGLVRLIIVLMYASLFNKMFIERSCMSGKFILNCNYLDCIG